MQEIIHKEISGNIVDIVKRQIFQGRLIIENGKIKDIIKENNPSNTFILPGFIDAHVHIESSMLTPSQFARIAVTHGTVATVSDPHEIANVLGESGIDFMINNGKQVPFKFYFGLPSCVPATSFETSGAVIDAQDTQRLLQWDDIYYLAEMMNFPGVLYQDTEVMHKLQAARKLNKPIDGHAPGLIGEKAKQYADAGISTDHECFTIEEAVSKIKAGMKIQIREGSAAKNFEELYPLIDRFPEKVMLCSDDKHPNDLVKGHINQLVQRAISKGLDFFNVMRSVSFNPVQHYKLDVGLLQIDDDADFIIVKDLKEFEVLSTFIKGNPVYHNGISFIQPELPASANRFYTNSITKEMLRVEAISENVKVIEIEDGQLLTKQSTARLKSENRQLMADTENDILKLVVLNRYREAKPAIGFIKGFGLKNGAISSTVAHDSHNIIALGVSDEAIVEAIQLIQSKQGGLVYVNNESKTALPLPIAGLMSVDDAENVSATYEKLENEVKNNGVSINSPFMTLSFMALLVIPELKLSDKGLFDGNIFEFTPLYVQ